jgi:hypothetical protein
MHLVWALQETHPIEDTGSAQYSRGAHAYASGAWGQAARTSRS